MRLSEKLILFVLAAAIVPLTLVAFGLLRQSERELTTRITEQQRAVAAAAAEEAGNQIMSAINGLASSAAVIDWQQASPEEAQGGLKLLMAQSDLIAAVALHDPARAAARPAPRRTRTAGRRPTPAPGWATRSSGRSGTPTPSRSCSRRTKR